MDWQLSAQLIRVQDPAIALVQRGTIEVKGKGQMVWVPKYLSVAEEGTAQNFRAMTLEGWEGLADGRRK